MNNNNKIRDDKRFNDFLASNIDTTINERYCQRCHLRLVHNPRNSPYDRYLYSCPQCNCTASIHNTEPPEKLVTMFPTHNASSATDKTKLVVQPDDQRLSRSQYFIKKNVQKKSEYEDNDPYLAILKKNNKITITNIEYFSPTAEEEDYDSR